MKYWLGVTDNDWFSFLSQQRPDEVNFWQPSGRAPFVGLEPGAPFLFKLRRPFNHVAGGGYFVGFSTLPLSMVWETFREKNGAPNRQAFEAMIRRLAPDPAARDPNVGCTILTQPFFWERDHWIESPDGWKNNIMRGRYYQSEDPDGARLWARVQAIQSDALIVREQPAQYGEPTTIMPRLGQGAFRVMVTDVYQRRCAITGETTLPVLEAAHILPFAERGPNEVGNGILLRSDFHKLFDLGLITVTPELNVKVSPKIRREWFNGKQYYRLDNQRLANIPKEPAHHPATTFLKWHNERRFQG